MKHLNRKPPTHQDIFAVDWMGALLRTQAASLQELCELYSEPIVIQILEKNEDPVVAVSEWADEAFWKTPNPIPPETHDYSFLERCVNQTGISESLQFYAWSYPYYRVWSESPIGFEQVFDPKRTDIHPIELLITEAQREAKRWREALPMVDPFRTNAFLRLEAPWNRLRSEIYQYFKLSPLAVIARAE